jgi:hypothetical protein
MLPTAVIQFCSAAPRISVGAAIPSINFGSMFTSLLMAGWPLAMAYWLVRGAPLIMRIAYPDTPASTKEETRIEGTLAHKADA